MSKIFIVIEGGCVRYVSSDLADIDVKVIDLDDMRDALDGDPEEVVQNSIDLGEAQALPRIW